MTPNLSILFATAPDRIGLVAELWNGDTMLAEVFECDGTFLLEVYRGDEVAWQIDARSAISLLSKALAELESARIAVRTGPDLESKRRDEGFC